MAGRRDDRPRLGEPGGPPSAWRVVLHPRGSEVHGRDVPAHLIFGDTSLLVQSRRQALLRTRGLGLGRDLRRRGVRRGVSRGHGAIVRIDGQGTEDDGHDDGADRQQPQSFSFLQVGPLLLGDPFGVLLLRAPDVLEQVVHRDVAGARAEAATAFELEAGREQQVRAPSVVFPLPALLKDGGPGAEHIAVRLQPTSELRPGSNERLVRYLESAPDSRSRGRIARRRGVVGDGARHDLGTRHEEARSSVRELGDHGSDDGIRRHRDQCAGVLAASPGVTRPRKSRRATAFSRSSRAL